MRRVRSRTAYALSFACSSLVILALLPDGQFSSAGPVWGQVSYQGRPLKSGTVMFLPTGVDQGLWASATIRENGCYAVPADWSRPGPGRGRYKICIIPGPRRMNLQPFPGNEGAPPSVVQVSGGTELLVSGGAEAKLEIPDRFTQGFSSSLEVSLGPEPACIDIDLKD